MTAKINSTTKQILREERRIEKEEARIVRLLGKEKYRNKYISKLARHKFLFSLIGGIGVVLVWRGLWDISATIPILESSGVALVVGLGILWALGKSDL